MAKWYEKHYPNGEELVVKLNEIAKIQNKVTYYKFSFGSLPEKAVVLRGTGQVLALNLNATTITGNAFTCFCEWVEE